MTLLDIGQLIVGVSTLAVSIVVARLDSRYRSDQKKATEREKALAQPSSIAAWLTGDVYGKANGVIQNSSKLPIYDVVVTAVIAKGGSVSGGEGRRGYCEYRSCFAVVPPGTHAFPFDMSGIGGMHRCPVLEIAYRCADGNSWVRRGDGTLERLEKPVEEFYGLGLPMEFSPID